MLELCEVTKHHAIISLLFIFVPCHIRGQSNIGLQVTVVGNHQIYKASSGDTKVKHPSQVSLFLTLSPTVLLTGPEVLSEPVGRASPRPLTSSATNWMKRVPRRRHFFQIFPQPSSLSMFVSCFTCSSSCLQSADWSNSSF